MRLGILGGTFDPVHNGHIAMARAALAGAGLDRVLLIPCARPPHKDRPALTDGYRRFAMLALALGDERSIHASPIELQRGGVSFTIDTLRHLAAEAPKKDLFLILGSDSFVEMETWRSFREILSLAAILVAPRAGADDAWIREKAPRDLQGRLLPPGGLARGAPGDGPPAAALLGMQPVDVSSTQIRARLREGRPVSGLVPASVETYIRRQELYGATLIA